ncbi:hypothetical protein BD779DRAFT_1561783 [Infundibulicybe gibba]|nr:hypothetical protein BD779DRAFT_1561783 [Infundibulicybe gibba]
MGGSRADSAGGLLYVRSRLLIPQVRLVYHETPFRFIAPPAPIITGFPRPILPMPIFTCCPHTHPREVHTAIPPIIAGSTYPPPAIWKSACIGWLESVDRTVYYQQLALWRWGQRLRHFHAVSLNLISPASPWTKSPPAASSPLGWSSHRYCAGRISRQDEGKEHKNVVIWDAVSELHIDMRGRNI